MGFQIKGHSQLIFESPNEDYQEKNFKKKVKRVETNFFFLTSCVK